MCNDKNIVDSKITSVSKEKTDELINRYTHDICVAPMLSQDELSYFTNLSDKLEKKAA